MGGIRELVTIVKSKGVAHGVRVLEAQVASDQQTEEARARMLELHPELAGAPFADVVRADPALLAEFQTLRTS